MPRFFVDKSAIDEKNIRITGDDVKHITKVLRLREGEAIEVCDKCGNDYECIISGFSDGEVIAEIKKSYLNTAEPPIDISLYQGMPKSDKMDYIIQKCVELGVVRIVPVITKRTVSIPKDTEKKTARWQKIAAEAAKQCGRGIIPEVENAIDFKEFINRVSSDNAITIMPYECEDENSLSSVLRETKGKRFNIFIGPEGGFDPSEVEAAKVNGAEIVTLGPRIMRTETAPLAVCSAIMYELGDW